MAELAHDIYLEIRTEDRANGSQTFKEEFRLRIKLLVSLNRYRWYLQFVFGYSDKQT